ncbi:ice-binding family protein [Rhodoferax ferrireducens]|uniref:ice-binding family protein n=1 Tax=Rhodoferax ferrireducens TaxID=192843 RepID=UPI0018E55A28|nr:ice-binding family protein [Rhodoferax ferrireducens]
MNNSERCGGMLRWFIVLLLAFIVLGCGSGGGGENVNGIQAVNPAVVPGAPGAIPPGTTPSGTALAGTTSSGTALSGSSSGTGSSGTGLTGTGSAGTIPSGSGSSGTTPSGTAPSGTTGTGNGPTVLSSNPTNGAINVAVSTIGSGNVVIPRTISATFSEAMNPASIVSPAVSFTVKETASGSSVAGSVSMNATNTIATFAPHAVLASNRQFTAIVTTAASNPAGTALVSNYGWSFTTGTQIGQAPINLGTAANFMVLGGTSIANSSAASNPTRVNGQLGIDPGSATNVTGFSDSTPSGTGIILTGGIQFGPIIRQAKNDLSAALAEANARTNNQISVGSNDLASTMVNGGSPGVYPPGLYASVSTLILNAGNMTLDAKGDPDAIWVFKAGSHLIVGDTRQILLLNGAKAANVFWTLGSSATLGDQVGFKGNILAGTSNTLGTTSALGTTVEGRMLSVSGLNMYAATVNAPAP